MYAFFFSYLFFFFFHSTFSHLVSYLYTVGIFTGVFNCCQNKWAFLRQTRPTVKLLQYWLSSNRFFFFFCFIVLFCHFKSPRLTQRKFVNLKEASFVIIFSPLNPLITWHTETLLCCALQLLCSLLCLLHFGFLINHICTKSYRNGCLLPLC